MDSGKGDDSLTGLPASGMWIGTSNRGYGKLAEEELRNRFELVRVLWMIAGDVFLFETAAGPREALDSIMEREPIFLRHMQPVHLKVAVTRSQGDLGMLREALGQAMAGLPLSGRRVAVQTRKAEGVDFDYAAVDVKRALDKVLADAFGAEPVVQGMDVVISVFLTEDEAYLGWSTPAQNLSSWSGGAVHFRKEDADISRAKFKLLEAGVRFGLDFADFRNALDIGAAPGGWSSLLLDRGLRVTAVDPAAMHPSLSGRAGFTHLRRNAADVRFRDGEFDLLVSDMSWDPLHMADLVKKLAPAIVPRGTAITTVKLLRGKPFVTVRHVENMLQPEFGLKKAKQLFHNRDELTVCWERLP